MSMDLDKSPSGANLGVSRPKLFFVAPIVPSPSGGGLARRAASFLVGACACQKPRRRDMTGVIVVSDAISAR